MRQLPSIQQSSNEVDVLLQATVWPLTMRKTHTEWSAVKGPYMKNNYATIQLSN